MEEFQDKILDFDWILKIFFNIYYIFKNSFLHVTTVGDQPCLDKICF